MDTLNENNEEPAPLESFQPEAAQPVIDELEAVQITNDSFNSHLISVFFSFTGGSILYVLSAASIVYGLGQIIRPTLAKSILLSQTLPCLLAINLYELALLAVLVVIVRFRNVTDDAISLLVLIGLFLVTSGLMLGTLTPGNPTACVIIGFICIAIAIGKLYALRRWVGFPVSPLSLIGFGLIFAWNFLAAPLMGKPLVSGDWPDDVRRGQWLLWWLILLLGAGLILIDAIRQTPRQKETDAFIRTKSMVWTFTLIVLAAAIFQYSTTYMYEIDWAWGDYLPLVVVFSLLLIELFRSLHLRYPFLQIIVSVVPLLATIYAIGDRQVMGGPSLGVEMLWYPPVVLGLTGLAMVVLAAYHRWTHFYTVAIAYGLGVVLTFGYTPDSLDLNWELFAACVVAILLVIGILKQNMSLCFAAVILLAGGLGATEGLARFARAHDMTIPGVIFGIAGVGLLAVSLVFGEKVHQGLIVLGSVCLVVCLFDYLPRVLVWKDLLALIGIVMLSGVLWFRTGFLYALPIFCIPLLPKFYLLARSMSSWGFVVLSFVLLGAGGAVSFFFKHDKPPIATTE